MFANTVRKLLKQGAPPPPRRRQRRRQLDASKAYLRQRYQQHHLSAVRLTQEIRPMGFTGRVILVRRFLHPFRQGERLSKTLTVRFETPPGQQAQCDWAEVSRYPSAEG